MNVGKLKILAKKKGMTLKLTRKGKQAFEYKKESGTIWDFDVSGGNIYRLVIAKNSLGESANIYYGDGSKSGIIIRSEKQLVNFMEEYN